jgi:predicted GIY-YIG superfamily endonuclease
MIMPFAATEYILATTTWNEVAGVYGILNSQRQMIYIGQTDNFKRRMAEHAADTEHCMHAYGPTYVWAEVITNKDTRLARETLLIAEYGPPCNG